MLHYDCEKGGLDVSFGDRCSGPQRIMRPHHGMRRRQLLTKRLASIVSWDKAHPNISWPSGSEPETGEEGYGKPRAVDHPSIGGARVTHFWNGPRLGRPSRD